MLLRGPAGHRPDLCAARRERGGRRAGLLIAVLLAACTLPGCSERKGGLPEERARFQFDPVTENRIRPGPVQPGDTLKGVTELAGENPYGGNAYAIQDGYRLYRWMNCSGCHGEGGGSIGPALWDEQWIYGGSPAQIAESILRGRPNGMPAYAGKLPESEVWKIVAYLQILKPGGGLTRAGAK
jgi:cytochrome c oxidase cbb3-type subunit III